MNRTLRSLLLTSVFCLVPFLARSQSTMEFQSLTTIEVTAGADICADVVTINGSYTGAGTQCGGALPVEIVAMTVQAAKNAVTLNWTTATETNNYGFEIERAAVSSQQSAVSWQKVGFVAGAGTSSSPRVYGYVDGNLSAGRHAYRIKQIDNDGKFAYTAAVEVEVGLAPREFTLSQNYPNPFNPTTTISFGLPTRSFVSLKIFDALGREVEVLLSEELSAGIHERQWNAAGIVSGVCFYRLRAGKFSETKKLVLLR